MACLNVVLLLFISLFGSIHGSIHVPHYDIVIYGGTSAGVIAAVQASKMGHSVLLIEPSRHLGGMTSNGLGWVDVEKPRLIGGLAREFFHRIWQHYQHESSWRWEKKRILPNQAAHAERADQLMWVFEPHVAERVFDQFIAESSVTLVKGERLNLTHGIQKNGHRIVEIAMESGAKYSGSVFIDASYEGDLMAAAGVSYTVGREPNTLYNETLNGIHANHKRGGMRLKIDPFLVRENPQSGLLPRIYANQGGVDGEGDGLIQAYNYRMCLTHVPENRIPIEKPPDYDEADFEIVFRAIEGGLRKEKFFKLDLMPNGKTDSNNNGPVSTDYVGMNWDYPEAGYAARKQIEQAHEKWQKGLVWTLQNHPRVPKTIRDFYSPWGLPKDEFVDNHHWPYQLYVREARRMVSSVVITENTVLGKNKALDGVGIGFYHIDSHIIKYFVGDDGYLLWEGSIFHKAPAPFPISYQSIVPKKEECHNLIVPVCLSASHVAYGAIRMEPVFMTLGQSAATAASLAIHLGTAVQDVSYPVLRNRLMKDGQIVP